VLQCSRRGIPHGSLRQLKVAFLVVVPALLLGGCGESSEVASGATVTTYVAAPLCAEAKRELARHGVEAGDVRVRAVCLPNTQEGRKLKLATIGANARRASEDSSSVAYIAEPTKAASRFAAPILEAADIPQLSQASGAAAMADLLQALKQISGDVGSLRQSVLDELKAGDPTTQAG
jgi:hypothetical protein